MTLGQGQGSQAEEAPQQRPRKEYKKQEERPRERKKRENPDFNFNPDSNYRLYYLNDPLFYEVVIKKEEAPYEFKIHLFLDGGNSSSTREITTQIMEKLNTYEAAGIKDTVMIKDRNEHNKSDKIRYIFSIAEKDIYVACAEYILTMINNNKL